MHLNKPLAAITLAFMALLWGVRAMGSDAEYLQRMVDIPANQDLSQVIAQASAQSGIPFCLEFIADRSGTTPQGNDLGQGHVALRDLISSVERSGYTCAPHGNALLVSNATVKTVADNPLNALVDNFEFNGTHAEFVTKMQSLVAGPSANIITIFGAVDADRHYEMKLKGGKTIRDILMEAASRYGITWSAEILTTAPVFEIKSPDGSTAKALGSRVSLSFWAINPAKGLPLPDDK